MDEKRNKYFFKFKLAGGKWLDNIIEIKADDLDTAEKTAMADIKNRLNIAFPGFEIPVDFKHVSEKQNTKMSYLYRDASNFKTQNEIVLKGEITKSQISRIITCLDAGEYFIPADVNLDEVRGFSYDSDIDHIWFELHDWDFELTDDLPTTEMTIDRLVEAFEHASEIGWDENAAEERLRNNYEENE